MLDRRRALGYRADRSASLLARRRTHLLGVSMSLTNPFHAELVEDIHLAASDRGYDVVVSPLTGVRDERQTRSAWSTSAARPSSSWARR